MSTFLCIMEGMMRLLGIISLAVLASSILIWAGTQVLIDIAMVLAGLGLVVAIIVAILLAVIWLINVFVDRLFSSRHLGDMNQSEVPRTQQDSGMVMATAEIAEHGPKLSVKAPPQGWRVRLLRVAHWFDYRCLFPAEPRLASILGLISPFVLLLGALMAHAGNGQKILGLAYGFGLLFLYWMFYAGLMKSISGETARISMLDISGLVILTALVTGVWMGLCFFVLFGLMYAVAGKEKDLKPSPWMSILILLACICGAKLLSFVQAFLGVGMTRGGASQRVKAYEAWLPGPDGNYWARNDHLDLVWEFLLQSVPSAIIVLGSAHFLGFL